jgi:peptidyl-tRNA hydrolase, PTH1 family
VESPAIRLIVGLGNPGREYEATRHNVGFMILDRVVTRAGARFASERKFEGHLARADGLFFLKPQTFMNLSGRAVQAVCHFYKIAPAEVLVVYDDVALPEGTLRLRESGSAGGHNGMKSIIATLGTDAFPRLRFGVGASGPGRLVSHVLGQLTAADFEVLDKSLEKAAEAVNLTVRRGLAHAMNLFNSKETKPKPPKTAPAPPPAPHEPPHSNHEA